MIDQIDEEEDEDGSSNGGTSLRLRNPKVVDVVKSPRVNIDELADTGENLRISTKQLRRSTVKKKKSSPSEEEKVIIDDDKPAISQNSSLDSVDRMWQQALKDDFDETLLDDEDVESEQEMVIANSPEEEFEVNSAEERAALEK